MHPLLEMLDLTQPSLTTVKSAVDAYDVRQALDMLVSYYRNRSEPDPTRLVGPDETLIERADEALRHDFTFYRERAVIPGSTLDWTYKPGTDWEWTWALNRHTWWPTLASAYLATADARYAQELDRLISSWVGEHPPSIHDLSAWRPLEAGIRMADAWVAILQALKTSPHVSRTAWLYYLRSIPDHAEFLMIHAESGSNRLLMEMNGLLTCGLLFPEFKRASDWIHFAMAQLETEMQRQVHPDGVQNEYSTGYQLVCIRHFAEALERVERVGTHKFSAAYRTRLIAMWESIMYLLRPDGRLPMLNDADQHIVSPLLRTAGERYERPDFVYAATHGKEGEPPAITSHRFPWGRRAVMRSGWQADAFYGLLETAPYGYGHQHEDALTFEVMAYGQPLIGTMGRYTYADDPIRQYLTSSRGHNVVLVDGHGQAQQSLAQSMGEPFDSARPRPLQANAQRNQPITQVPYEWTAHAETNDPWICNERFDVAHGRYDGPWANGVEIGPWERRMLFHKPARHQNRPGFWLIQDTFSGFGSHELKFLFHFFPGEVAWNTAEGHIISRYGSDTGNILVQFANMEQLQISASKGETEPPGGWYSREYGHLEAAWELVARRSVAFPANHIFALIPFYGAQAPIVKITIATDHIMVMIDGQQWPVPHENLC